jgi:hypothetical protein
MDRDEAKPPTARQKATKDRGQKGERTTLDACYGRIGIPAVAAALTPRQTERRPAQETRFTPYDRD